MLYIITNMASLLAEYVEDQSPDHFPPASSASICQNARINNEASNIMKLFKISDINLVEPYTVLAESRDRAADYFIACLNRGFGHLPVIEYAVTRWNPRNIETMKGLSEIVGNGQKGWALENGNRWDFFDPFAMLG